MTPAAGRIPAGACDAHVHLFGPLATYPASLDAPYVVPDLGAAQLLQCMHGAGVGRAVIVHAAVSGRDNHLTLDALRAHPQRFRGVIVPPLERPDDDALRHWHALGVRGVRFSYTRSAQAGMAIDQELLARMAALGWHAQVHLEPHQLLELEASLSRLGVPVVIDHMARIPAAEGAQGPAFAALQRLLERGHVWVKLSAPMRLSASSGPPYADVMPMVQALARQAPQRMLWGSDWPHVNLPSAPPPYAVLLGLICDWLDDPALIRQVLVDNPAELYGFAAAAAA